MKDRRVLQHWLLSLLITLLITGCSPRSAPPPLDDAALGKLVQDAIEGVRKQSINDPRLSVFEVTATVQQGKAMLTGRVMPGGLKDAVHRAVSAITGLKGVDDQLMALPNPSLGAKGYALANQTVVNLGLKPGQNTGKSLATQAALGEIMRIQDESNGWYLVNMWDGYLGWVNGSSIARMSLDEVNHYRSGAHAEITAKTTALRSQPGGTVMMQAVQGVSLPIRPTQGSTGQIELLLPDGRSAWVAKGDIRVHESAVATFATRKGIEAVIASAKQYIGLPYLWGGTTSLGFDCSGFTQFALRVNGYNVLRDADMQFRQGDPVERNDLRRGDLVFFSTYKAGPSHMGIYLGDGEYIHSSSSLGVAISSLDPKAKNYHVDLDKSFLGGRRVIK